ncbi:SMN protein Smn1 [Tyrophagus putrescentiae]|nr:SMN protein Smn1 [Tyrophagus putrescentiae]
MNTVKPPQGEDRPGHSEEEEEEVEDGEDESAEYEDEDDVDLNDDDIWDDSVLIKMYEASQKQINDELTKRFTGRTSEEVAQEETSAEAKTSNTGEGSESLSTNTNSNNDGKSSTSANAAITTSDSKKKLVKSSKLTVKSKICPTASSGASNRHLHQQPPILLSKPMYNWKEGAFCQATYLEDGVDYEAKIVAINVAEQTCTIRYIGYENEEHRALVELKPSAGERVRKLQIDMAIQDGYSGGVSTKATMYNNNNFSSDGFEAEGAPVSSSGHQRPAMPELSLIPTKMHPQQQQHSLHSHHHHHQQQQQHYHLQHNFPPPQSNLMTGSLGGPTHLATSTTSNPNRIIPPPPPFLSPAGPEGASASVATVLQAITNGPSAGSSMGGALPTEDDDDVLASMLMSWYMTGYHTGYYQARKDLMKG